MSEARLVWPGRVQWWETAHHAVFTKMWLRFLFWSFADHFLYIQLINQRKAMREKGEDNVLQVGAMVTRDDQMVRIKG